MLNEQPVIAFAPSTDLERSRAFYAGVLELELIEMTPYACVLRGGGTQVRVTLVDGLRPQPFTILGWTVDAMGPLIDRLAAEGVSFLRYEGMPQDDQGVWTTPGGDQVAWFNDPDGNVLSLTRFAAP